MALEDCGGVGGGTARRRARLRHLAMRPRAEYLEGLLAPTSHADPTARRALSRQTLASLALVDALDGSTPLASVSPDGLLRSVQTAMADGLLDDLSWLAPAAASVALYEIAGAL